MSRFLSNFFLRAHLNSRDPENNNTSRDVEKGSSRSQDNVLSEEHSTLHDDPLLDDAELDLEEENDEDEVNEINEDHEDHEELEHEETNGGRSLFRRASLTGVSLFSAASIDFRYRSRSPPKWYLKLKAFLYPPDPMQGGDDSSFVPNYRYTPIFSAILIPFSILLEIPGLTTNWYIRTIDNQTVEKRPNPVILDVGLAISFACAVAANVALIMRFLERNIKLMTLLCVMFLTLHDIINIVAVTTFGIEHRFDDGFTYGQSFWMTLCSTIASTITNATLIADFIRTPDFANSGSGLTRKQRSLVIIVIILLAYLAFGALIEAIILDLNFIDALYFTVCSIETIGFGDITPTTPGSKVFDCFYSVFGIINLVLAVSLTRETVLEALEAGYRKRLHAARTKRKNLRWQRRVARRWRDAVGWRLREKDQPLWVPNQPTYGNNSSKPLVRAWAFIRLQTLRFVDWSFPQWTWTSKGKGPGAVLHPKGMHLNLEALEGPALEGAAMEAGVPLSELLPPGFAKRWTDKHPPLEGDNPRLGGGIVPGSTLMPFPMLRDNSRNSATSQFGASAWAWISRLQNAQRSYDPREVPLTHARLGRMVAMLGGFALAVDRSETLKGSAPIRGVLSRRPVAVAADTTTATITATAATPPTPTPILIPTTSARSDSSSLPLSPATRKQPPKSLSQQFDAYRVAVEKEETKAFYARLIVVWVIFVVFWVTGSGVFMAAEGWSFGNAMYFSVIAFTTIGYGDFSPKTPAGRSIFVGWALLGVATMTILISVIAEAYTSRYKNILQSTKIFDRAVNKFKAREKARALLKEQEKKKPKASHPATSSSSHLPDTTPEMKAETYTSENHKFSPYPYSHMQYRAFSDSHLSTLRSHGHISRSLYHADKKLEELPRRILTHARAFHEHIQYFVGPESVGSNRKDSSGDNQIPQSLKKLMDDISGPSKFGEKISSEILQDKDARQTLFTLSIERSLRKMIEAAEDAIESLEERDRLIAMNGEHEHDHDYDGHSGVTNANINDGQRTEVPPPTKSDLRFTTNHIEGLPRRRGSDIGRQ